MSFDPRFIDLDKQFYITRIPRDEEAIARLSARIESAIAIAETIQGEKNVRKSVW